MERATRIILARGPNTAEAIDAAHKMLQHLPDLAALDKLFISTHKPTTTPSQHTPPSTSYGGPSGPSGPSASSSTNALAEYAQTVAPYARMRTINNATPDQSLRDALAVTDVSLGGAHVALGRHLAASDGALSHLLRRYALGVWSELATHEPSTAGTVAYFGEDPILVAALARHAALERGLDDAPIIETRLDEACAFVLELEEGPISELLGAVRYVDSDVERKVHRKHMFPLSLSGTAEARRLGTAIGQQLDKPDYNPNENILNDPIFGKWRDRDNPRHERATRVVHEDE